MSIYDVVIIGGGASGMMSSIFAARRGLKVLLLEHNEKLGKKLFITGKGRCNLTNNSSIENHLNNIVTNPKFMYSALNKFSPQDVIEFFTGNGLKLKTERGNRVFPVSDKSSDVIKTLTRLIDRYGVEVMLNADVKSVSKDDELFNTLCSNGVKYTSLSVIVATGGISYSATGSTGIGYEIASSFGHEIVPVKSALCPIVIKEDISELNGLSLKNVTLTIECGAKTYSEQGEMMFTFSSLTGPIALSLSSRINRLNLCKAVAVIDFKPALSVQKLEDRILRELESVAKKDLSTYLHSMLPSSIINFFMRKLGLKNKKMSELSKSDRLNLINGLKRFDLHIKSVDNINVGIVTSGGVNVRDINPKTCESKLVDGLCFVGEVLDVDALTGGYNLQIAWSTSYLAGNSIRG